MFHPKWNSIHGFRSGAPQDQFQGVTREDTAKQKTKELHLIAVVSLRLSLTISLLFQPVCAPTRLLLISEAPSFVFVRCPKDCRMKRDTWRGAAWLRRCCANANVHTHTHDLASEPSPSSFLWQSLFPTTVSLETRGKVWWETIRTWITFNWNRTKLKGKLGEQQTNYQPSASR